jgi:hypothetical protein
MNKFNPRSIGRLLEMPGVGKFLADALAGGSEEGLRRLVKAGKLTGPKIIEALAQSNAKLDAEFAKVPVKLTGVFTKMNNELVRAASYVWKVTGGFSVLGGIIWNVFNTASSMVVGFVNALGGLQSTIELIGITLMVALGPLLIRQIILATASLVQMAVASWSVWAPWIAIGAAIVLAGLALQDMIIWMRGGPTKTVFGDMLGPFAEFKKQIEDFPIVKIFEGITKFFSGDFGSAWKTIAEGFANIKTPADALWLTVETIGGAFVLWEAMKFTGIIGALGTLGNAFRTTKTEVDATTTAIQRSQNAANAPGAPATTGGAPATTGGPRNQRTPIGRVTLGAGMALPFVLDATILAQNAGIAPKLPEAQQNRLVTAALGSNLGATIGAGIGAFFGGVGAAPGAAIGGAAGGLGGLLWPELSQAGTAIWNKPNWAPEWMNQGLGDTIAELVRRSGVTLNNTNPSAEQRGVPSYGQMPQSSLVPRVMPYDSLIPTKTVANTVNAGGITQNNTITVTAEMNEAQVATAVQRQVEATAPALLERVSRQLSDAIPLSERATV